MNRKPDLTHRTTARGTIAVAPIRSVPYRDKQLPVRGTMKVAGREYLILDEVNRQNRRRLLVYQPWKKLGGEFRQVLAFPRGHTSRQHLRVLQRIAQGNPNLPTILELAAQRDEYLVVTNWVRGDDLQSYLDRFHDTPRGLPSPFEAIRLYRGLAHGLSHLHRRHNVVHADIKPENLILAKAPNRLVMIDFGSAWTIETSYRRVVGDGRSEHYAAPELQTESPSGSSRSDQFSASVVAYYMLTGKLPYGDMGGKAGLPEYRADYERLYKPPSRLSPRRQEIPTRIWQPIDDTISRALSLDPEKRFQTGSAWLEALEDLHCEMRRKPQLNVLDRTFMRAIEQLQRYRQSRRAPK